ncbi:hypothetical protein PJ985_02505 [Streptomyces sp. ACA25]|uniref:hypothetical protein n=1 Tax=Streptomyces sp. ACA25 TaxID=3022596 RepID=UPI00230767DA|nr:hypothetical protein [Streptomyces sp. ACA25]MDB1086446.1 hypothetical protein [Streptomyces sp. ACA25]
MLTIVIIVVAALVIAAAAAFFFLGPERFGIGRGHALKRRFGPEYDRAVAEHNGDTKAAERALDERVKQHGSLTARPLGPEAHERYTAQWSDIERQFVDSPQEALVAADALLAHLVKDRGFPGEQFEEQVSALSVHHAGHVHGYRNTHAAARGESGTEDMRQALIDARGFFDALVTEKPADADRRGPRSSQSRSQGHSRWQLGQPQTKGSNT